MTHPDHDSPATAPEPRPAAARHARPAPEARARALFLESPVATALLTPQGRIEELNLRAQTLLRGGPVGRWPRFRSS